MFGRGLMVVLVIAFMACSRGTQDTQALADACYRSTQSVLLGPPIGKRNVGHPPGWIRLEGFGGPRGAAELVDSNRSGLSGEWSRQAGDSLRVVAFDDFLRTELHVVAFADTLSGRGEARSDADIEPDSAGQPGEVRRGWEVNAVRVSCDSMPRRWDGG